MRALAPRPILLVLAALLALGAGGDLKPGERFAEDLFVAETPKEGDDAVRMTLGKGVTAVVDLQAKCPVRVDRAVRGGTRLDAIFPTGKRVAVLGKRMQSRPGARAIEARRIAPVHAVVVGDGLVPARVLPAARDKLGPDVEWFTGAVVRVERPNVVWLEVGSKELAITVGRDDRVLETELHKEGFAGNPDLRGGLAKGRLARVFGKISALAHFDRKGDEIEGKDAAKRAARTEVRVAPERVVLLDPNYDYSFVEAAE